MSGPLKVLLVEDEEDDIELFHLAIKRAGVALACEVARDGDCAIGMLREVVSGQRPCPDLVLLDLNLPLRSGFDVLESARREAKFCGVPIVVLTASKASKDIEQAYALGATTYFCKPSTLHDLTDWLGILVRYWTQALTARRSGSPARTRV